MVNHHADSFGSHGYFISGRITVSVCHVMLEDHVAKELRYLKG